MLQGILSEVKYGSKVLNGNWSITGFPLENVKINSATNNETENLSIADGPVLYESYFTIPDAQPLDTFLDPTGWGKVFFCISFKACRYFYFAEHRYFNVHHKYKEIQIQKFNNK